MIALASIFLAAGAYQAFTGFYRLGDEWVADLSKLFPAAVLLVAGGALMFHHLTN